MRATDFLSDRVGISVDGEIYIPALRCLTEWLDNGTDYVLHPEAGIYEDEGIDWEEEVIYFRKELELYLDREILTAREFLVERIGFGEELLERALEDMRDWLVDDIELDDDITEYIEEYFDGNIDSAVESFRNF